MFLDDAASTGPRSRGDQKMQRLRGIRGITPCLAPCRTEKARRKWKLFLLYIALLALLDVHAAASVGVKSTET